MHTNDLVRMRHMLDAANEATAFLRGKPKASLGSDRMLTLSLTRCIEIIGEAAARVSKEGQAAHPEIPWALIIGMRNRLIHAYFDVDAERLWDTVFNDLPSLITELKKIIPI